MYCNRHHANNCVECAIERQTEAIVAAIQTLQPAPSLWQRLVARIRAYSRSKT